MTKNKHIQKNAPNRSYSKYMEDRFNYLYRNFDPTQYDEEELIMFRNMNKQYKTIFPIKRQPRIEYPEKEESYGY